MGALWFALFSPIDYDARMHSLYVFFFLSLCTVCVCVCVCVNESQRVHHAVCCALFHPSLYMTQTLLFPAVIMHPLPLDRNKHSLIRREHTRANTCIQKHTSGIHNEHRPLEEDDDGALLSLQFRR